MDRKKMILRGVMLLLVALMLTGCAGYYSGYGYYDNPYYNDYDYGYYAYPYYHGDHQFGEHHREFGQSPKWGGEHQRSGGHPESGEHHHDRH